MDEGRDAVRLSPCKRSIGRIEKTNSLWGKKKEGRKGRNHDRKGWEF